MRGDKEGTDAATGGTGSEHGTNHAAREATGDGESDAQNIVHEHGRSPQRPGDRGSEFEEELAQSAGKFDGAEPTKQKLHGKPESEAIPKVVRITPTTDEREGAHETRGPTEAAPDHARGRVGAGASAEAYAACTQVENDQEGPTEARPDDHPRRCETHTRVA